MQKSPSPPPKPAKGANASVLTGSPKKEDPKAVSKKEEAAKKEEDEKRAAEVAKLQKKEETSEERFMKVQICEQERDNLKRVFALFIAEQKAIAHAGKGKKEHGKESKIADINSIDWFDSKAVRAILAKLGVKEIREHDIDIMIWEVDENLDSRVDWKEFELMYKKCIEDQLGLEPRNLFNLVQFLMFCKPPEDEKGNPRGDHEFKTQIKAEDTYFLIYGRLDRQEEQKRKRLGDNKPVGNGEILKLLDDEIKLIFMDFDSKNEAIGGRIIDPEMQIDYLTYLRRVNKQALNKRQEGKEKRKVVKEAKEK